MQIVQKIVKVLLLLIVILTGTQVGAYADEMKSVKDWYDNPDSVNEEGPAQVENTENKEAGESTTVGITVWDFLKMIFALIFVIALLYFLLKFINKKSHVYKDSQVVQNIGGASLGANRSVQMIKVGERVLVVGVGENIQLLKEIEDEEEARQIIQEYNNKMEQLISPSDIVTKVMKRTKSVKMEDKDKENSSFPSILKNQLDHISKERKKLYEEMEKKGPDER